MTGAEAEARRRWQRRREQIRVKRHRCGHCKKPLGKGWTHLRGAVNTTAFDFWACSAECGLEMLKAIRS